MTGQRLRLSPLQICTIVGVVVVHTASVFAYIHTQFQGFRISDHAISERVARLETGSIYVERTLAGIDRKVDALDDKIDMLADRLRVPD